MRGKMKNEMFKYGVMTAIIAVAMPEFSAAQAVNDVINNFQQEQLPVLPRILSAVAYVGGAFMMVSGALSLKKHAENPASEPMSKGVSRLLTGGVITAVPALTGVLQNTVNLGADEAQFNSFSTTFNP